MRTRRPLTEFMNVEAAERRRLVQFLVLHPWLTLLFTATNDNLPLLDCRDQGVAAMMRTARRMIIHATGGYRSAPNGVSLTHDALSAAMMLYSESSQQVVFPRVGCVERWN